MDAWTYDKIDEAVQILADIADSLKRFADFYTPIPSKDEPSSSEKPNNCEHITEDGVTCAKYPACDDCLDNPLNKVKGSERLVKGSEQTDCQTCKWWSSYGYCVHRECKGYEPQTERSEQMIDSRPRIGAEVYIHGYIDEIRKDVIIIRNEGGCFGTVPSEMLYYEEDERGYGTMNDADTPQTDDEFEEPNYYDPALWE